MPSTPGIHQAGSKVRCASPREERFGFGHNWAQFLSELGPEQIRVAREDLERLLGRDDLTGTRFLDLGSGSGLMSLVAHQLGAEVTAFDLDPLSVATTEALRDRHAGRNAYVVRQGSVLDDEFLVSLGTHDIVYSWGVLHHTGDMWGACERVVRLVATGGVLVLALYNSQGWRSDVWRGIKRTYISHGPLVKWSLVSGVGSYLRLRHAIGRAIRSHCQVLRPVERDPESRLQREHRARGMSRKRDLVDWVGGYPFEVAEPHEVFDFFKAREMELERLRTCGGGGGCNEFVFRRR